MKKIILIGLVIALLLLSGCAKEKRDYWVEMQIKESCPENFVCIDMDDVPEIAIINQSDLMIYENKN